VKRLFSPWRSAYIDSFKKKQKKSEKCLFCRIATEDRDDKNLVIWRGEHCYVVLNLFPYNSGHAMIVPYRHVPGIGDLRAEEHREIMNAGAKCIDALTKTSKPHGFNFGANIGRAAGAGIEHHLHFHVVPRWEGDTNFMPVLGETKLISEDLKRTWTRLRRRMST